MLVAGPNSVCDVCLEPFGCDGKAPCSISCGHVFCVDCLDRVTKPSCPLCRNYFDSRATIKLHLDLDAVKPLSPSSNATDLDHDEDARRLRDAINRVTKEGCSESQIRQLIQDGNKFFQRAPKGRYKELKTLHRMITYMCDVKSSLRQERVKVDQLKKDSDLVQKEKEALEEEKARLLREIEERNKEKEAAFKLEGELRDHCSRAHEAYTSMIDQYNYVAKEWAKLNEEVKLLRTAPSSDAIVHSSPPTLELDCAQLNGAAIREGNSILCTPLPQFDNSVLQTEKSMFFKPLPGVGEEDEDEEDEDDDEDDEDEDESSSEESDPEPSDKHVLDYPVKYSPAKADPSEVTCSSATHPYSCKCSGYSTDVVVEPRKMIEYPQPTRPTYVDRLKPALVSCPPQSGLTQNAPRNDVRRARSYSNPSTSSSRTQSTSRSTSRSPSPPIRSLAPSHFGAAFTSPLSQDSRGLQATLYSPPPKNTDSDSLRSRLHSILTDPSSSSPPKSNQTSASMASRPPREDRALSSSRSPSPPRSSNPHRANLTRRGSVQHQSSTDQFSRMLASHQPVNSGYVPPLSTSPNTRMSSASQAARAIEQSKRDRKYAASADPEDWQNRRQQDRERSQPEREAERARPTSSSQVATTASSASSGLHRSGTVVHSSAPNPSLASRPSTSSFHSAPSSAYPTTTSPSVASYYSPPSQPQSYRYPNPSPNKGIPSASVLMSPHVS